MQTRFSKPYYRIIPLDDADFKLVRTCKNAQKNRKDRVCVVVGIHSVDKHKVPKTESQSFVWVIKANLIWGRADESLHAARIESVTIGDPDDDQEDVSLEFADDLVRFLDSYDGPLDEVISTYFRAL